MVSETHTVKTETSFRTLERENRFKNPPKDKSAFPALLAAVEPHVASFNAITEENGLLDLARKDIGVKTVVLKKNEKGKVNKISFRIDKMYVGKPQISRNDKTTLRREIYPAECRERGTTYRGKLTTKLGYRINDGPWDSIDRECGNIPIMLRSNRCHLAGLSPYDLIERKEESEELGGYFIVNGVEKLIRMLIVQRRNFPMAIIRNAFSKRGKSYTHFGVVIRCVRPDQTSQTNVLHYLNDGNATFRFSWRKNEYLVPVMMILKALVETNDREIFDGLVTTGEQDNTFLTDRVELLLRTYKAYQLYTQKETLQHLGEKFRVVMRVSEDKSDVEVGEEFLRRIVLVHLESPRDKFRMILFMLRKLYSLVEGSCCPDNPDSLQNQEILLGGFLYGQIIKERAEEWIEGICAEIRREASRGTAHVDFSNKDTRAKLLQKANDNIGQALNHFLATGNLASPSGLDLQQTSGFTVVAEKINFYRFISHFRMVHRGSFFAQLKTTTVRKLLPESWGFLCPVHTPDGSPCGLLNHLAHKCRIMTTVSDTSTVRSSLVSLGITSPSTFPLPPSASISIQLDGCILGWCSPKKARVVADTLRYWKVERTHGIPLDLEIGYVPPSNGGQYPGLFLFSQQARMVRPVKYLALGKEDQIGPFEQPYMSIAVTEPEIVHGESTHVEFDPTNILSILANMTPFSEFNQSPRNMYQCQMSKQTMGTPTTALRYRADNKLYRLQTGQTPVVRSPLYDEYGLDNFPNGVNAVVAVISYTGYDMDDAMILNKSAHERGFGHGTIYKTERVGWVDRNKRVGTSIKSLFGFKNPDEVQELVEHFEYDNASSEDEKVKAFKKIDIQKQWLQTVDTDGLPVVGAMVKPGDAIAVYHDIPADGNYDSRSVVNRAFKYKGDEVAYIEEVRLLANESEGKPMQEISVKYRIPRSPNIGDKFSSRHGQKGVASQKWPAVDMPFTESGIQPDIIINPHAFPSRMTIGMFVESLAGKAGALHGIAQDSTPFRFSETHTAVDYFGHQLKEAGYHYYGNEPMYSGITGEELHADMYIGIVYYQRLRHMVNDKYQVRTTGKVSELTHQPIKGRKKGGGIRVGEMERDSLLAHGTAFLLQDRLFNCSDYTQTWICRACGSFLSTMPIIKKLGFESRVRCRRCAKPATGFEEDAIVWEDGQGRRFVGGGDTTTVAVPYVLKYLDVELAAMGIALKFNVTP